MTRGPVRRPTPRAPLLLRWIGPPLRLAPPWCLLAPAVFVAPGRPAAADPAPGATDENPRNVRREGPILPYLRADARPARAAPGERRAFPEGEIVRWSVAPDLPEGRSAPRLPRFTLDRRPREPVRDGGAGDATGGAVRWTATSRREELVAEIDGDRCEVATDALGVVLLVERETLEAGNRRFGSLVRRVRASLDALDELFAASVSAYAPRGVEERFRLAAAFVYDRAAGPASAGLDPGAFDLAWVLDDGAAPGTAPDALGDLPRVGGAGAAGPGAPAPWSLAWEHARWRECLRARGLPRLEAFAPAPGTLPGRLAAGLPLPAPFADDLAAEGAVAPRLSEWTAIVLNQRRGVVRPRRVDDPAGGRFGLLHTWIPGRVDLEIVRGRTGGDRRRGESGGEGGEGGPADTGGAGPAEGLGAGAGPIPGAVVRWWRARADGGLPSGLAGVAPGRSPDGVGTCGADGRVALAGDLLGRSRPPSDRSPWLLLEVQGGAERRLACLSALDLALAYARGAKYAAVVRLEWGRLAVPDP